MNTGFARNVLIGTWSWGKGGNGSKMVFGQNFSEEQLRDVFDKAYEAGFTAWDTAEVYGMGASERLVGKFADRSDLGQKQGHHSHRGN